MARLFSIIVVVVLVLILGVVAYLAYVSSVVVLPVSDNIATSTSQQILKSYSAPMHGLSFKYSDAYELTEKELGNAERKHYAITLIRKTDLPPPQNGEGPPSISIDVFQNDLDTMTLHQWLTGTNDSNFKLSDGSYASTTVDGKEAIRYHWSGLYEADSVAFLHKNNIILISGMYLDTTDAIRKDFQNVLASVQLD